MPLYKMVYNHLLFRDRFHSRIDGEYDEAGRLRYKNLSYITDSDQNLYNYETSMSHFVGLNEPVLAEVINRCLKEIYVLQTSLLGMCSEVVINKYPYSSQVVVLQ